MREDDDVRLRVRKSKYPDCDPKLDSGNPSSASASTDTETTVPRLVLVAHP